MKAPMKHRVIIRNATDCNLYQVFTLQNCVFANPSEYTVHKFLAKYASVYKLVNITSVAGQEIAAKHGITTN